ncbi:MAG: hypothetical protein JKY95_19960 [Planctomycetaceae bacterium]|nr:hypothetical protein [Planctomycetaceae bacterium]
MKNGYKALAVSARKQAAGYDKKMQHEMSDGTGERAEYYMKLAGHQRNEALVYDREAAKR